jgi:hypothetical protein
MSHLVVLFLPPPPEEGHLDVDETFGRVIRQDRDDRIQDVLHANIGYSLKTKHFQICKEFE